MEINLLLVALLKKLGVQSGPVLASTKDNGIPIYPTLSGFNYVLAGVRQGDSWTLLDATEKNAIFGLLPERIRNWEGRFVSTQGTTEPVLLYANKHAEHKSMAIATLRGKSLSGKVRMLFSNNYNLEFTNQYKSLADQSRLDKLNRAYEVEGKEEVAFKFSDIKNPKPASVSFDFEDDIFVEEIENRLYVQLQLFLSRVENPFVATERKFPIDFKYPTNNENIVTLNIPEGYGIKSLPKDLEITLPGEIGEYKFISKLVNGNSVQTLSSLRLNKTLGSAAFYKEIREFYAQIVSKEKETIILEKI